MFGLFNKKRNLVVLDTKQLEVTNAIAIIVEAFTGQSGVYKPLDREHTFIWVMEFYTTNRRFKDLKDYLDKKYPGVCAYDVNLRKEKEA